MNTVIIMSMLLTFLLGAVIGPLVLPWLRRLKFGQSIFGNRSVVAQVKAGHAVCRRNYLYNSDLRGYAYFGGAQPFFG